MKRIFNLLLVMICFSVTCVYAANNKLYFTESNDRLYYDGSLTDDEFMKHLDLVPGSVNEDILTIENGTNTDYTLYLKVVPKNDSEKARELLANLKMQIYLDNLLIYDGVASGTDYIGDGVNLQNATKIGQIIHKKSYTLKVITTLNKEYDNTENDEYSLIDWTFYAEYNKEVKEVVKTPITGKNNYMYIIYSLLLVIFTGIVIYIFKKKK